MKVVVSIEIQDHKLPWQQKTMETITMNFPVGAFAKIDNLSKMCNLDNSFNNPKEKEKS